MKVMRWIDVEQTFFNLRTKVYERDDKNYRRRDGRNKITAK